MKKLLFWTLLASIAAIFSFAPAFAQQNGSAVGGDLNAPFGTQTNVDDINIKSWSSCGADTPVLICGIKRLVNWVLGLLALIALLILLWAGFKMLTANGDTAKYDEGFTILKQAAVWLAFIAASYIIVQFIMYVIGKFVG